MQEGADKIVDLILKSLREEISEGEKSELDKLIAGNPAYRRVYNELKSGRTLKSALRSIGQIDTEYWWQKINEKMDLPMQAVPVKQLTTVGWKIAAAVAVLIVGAGVYYFFLRSEAANIKLLGLTTPKGKQYAVTLPDGSYVLLNSASTFHYPAVFSGKERRVEITGEAIFNIKPSQKPFVVAISPGKGSNAEIRVTGTRFNVKAYQEESTITATLLEGKITITADAGTEGKNPVTRKMVAGEQAEIIVTGKGSTIKVMPLENPGKAVTWQQNIVSYDDVPLTTIMRQVERWYDVEVVYRGEIAKKGLTFPLNRTDGIADVVAKLQLVSGCQISLEGRKIIVTP
jgi:ferric-dicitrate binding protein FerR (iron transport regulator)